MASNGFKNHLKNETSPYLLQHVDNPVDWYPWNDAALIKAQHENKPILVSIGYSACHWCHVMAHESFEDEETALIMNKLFVNIKVDREERPDLDKIYQIAHQMLTRRSGGWPLTVFLSPNDLTPFFAGTYFPKQAHYNLPSFKDILISVSRFYQEQPDAISQQNEKLRELLARFNTTRFDNAVILTGQPLSNAIDVLLEDYDQFNGGFGSAPKFPQPHYLNRFLHHAHYQNDPHLLGHVCNTLIKMAQGGIYDQLGGGFYRYSVDAHWHIPHFEKMLYDNGQLLSIYSDAYAATGDRLFKEIIITTGLWGIREMQSAQGGFYSTLDADSEHQEGKFYRWTQEEIATLLSEQEYMIIKDYFNLQNPANFEGYWHLYITHSVKQIADQFQEPVDDITDIISSARQKLFTAREQRIHPGRDEKILTAWNGLMIQGMASAGMRLQRCDFIDSAQKAVDFIRQHLWVDHRLYAVYKDGKARFMAYLDDYAFLLNGLLILLQAKWRSVDLHFAKALADTLLKYYAADEGGFFFTAHDHERLLQRMKPFADEAIPAGNGIAASALARLGHLLGEPRYLAAAEKTLNVAWHFIEQAPSEYHSLLVALEDYLSSPEIIILRGDNAELAQWQALCQNDFNPQRLVFAIPTQTKDLPEMIAQKTANNGITAYICKGHQCAEPVVTVDALRQSLKGN